MSLRGHLLDAPASTSPCPATAARTLPLVYCPQSHKAQGGAACIHQGWLLRGGAVTREWKTDGQ